MHNDLIGKRTRDTVKITKDVDVRVYLPTMAEYVTMTPRLVTPIYPADANLTVSMLDLYVSPSLSIQGSSTLEILEAGTGHGALTLYLARAIHAANPRPLNSAQMEENGEHIEEGTNLDAQKHRQDLGSEEALNDENKIGPTSQSRPQDSEKRREVVIHTVEISSQCSKNAIQMVKGFRQGMYRDDIEFHTGDVSDWINKQIVSRGIKFEATFLSHIILDMPSAQHHVEKAASALHVDGTLLAFNPSITQIMAIVEVIKRRFLPLQLDRIVELGHNLTGGRDWDIRLIKPKVRTRAERGIQPTLLEGSGGDEVAETANEVAALDGARQTRTADRKETTTSDAGEDDYHMICRPKVIERFVGGGFLGVWKKMKK